MADYLIHMRYNPGFSGSRHTRQNIKVKGAKSLNDALSTAKRRFPSWRIHKHKELTPGVKTSRWQRIREVIRQPIDILLGKS